MALSSEEPCPIPALSGIPATADDSVVDPGCHNLLIIFAHKIIVLSRADGHHSSKPLVDNRDFVFVRARRQDAQLYIAVGMNALFHNSTVADSSFPPTAGVLRISSAFAKRSHSSTEWLTGVLVAVASLASQRSG